MKLSQSILIVLILGVGVFFLVKNMKNNPEPQTEQMSEENTNQENSELKEEGNQEVTEIMMTVVKEGTGEVSANGDTVLVHYSGYLEDGTKFDSSVDRGTPFEFTIGAGQVISGWEIGVSGMKVGEVRRLILPPAFAYGEMGVPGVIPPNAVLAFEVELLEIK